MPIILVVESQLNTQLFLRILLEQEGYEVMVTSDGYEAVKIFVRTPAKIVICNLLNPSRDGLQTIKDIKTINSSTIAMILSGSETIESSGYLQAALKLEVQATVAKPFDILDFLKCIHTLLSKQALLTTLGEYPSHFLESKSGRTYGEEKTFD